MLRLCGLWNVLVSVLSLISLPVLAESLNPAECLQQSTAVEQSSALLQTMTATPTPPFVPLLTRGEAKFVSTAALFADVIDVSPGAIILNDIEELRFIPYTLAGSSLLLVLKSAPDWTAEKSRKVVSVAKALKLTLSLVWLDESLVPTQLAATIAETNGRIVRQNELMRAVLEKYCLTP